MIHERVDESTINASLDAYLHGAQEGDTHQAQHLHELLEMMLKEKELPEGRLWLTEHGKALLAEMHHELSLCEGKGDHLANRVLDAVQLKPHEGKWHDTNSFLRDLRIAIALANELCEQRDTGLAPDVILAANRVAERGEYQMDPFEICDIYEEIAAEVGGFKEISRY
jgi:hypothetical protein